MLPSTVIEVREYVTVDGSNPYAKWFNGLNAQAAAKVAIAITRIARVICRTQRALEAGFKNTASISGRAIESTLAETVTVC